MWLWAFAVTIASWAATAAFPSANPPLVFVVIALTGWYGNGIYLQRGITKIQKIKSDSKSEAEMLTRIDKAGGVSKLPGWIGGIAFALINVLSLYVVLQARFPQLGF
jgi:hypothetical protein